MYEGRTQGLYVLKTDMRLAWKVSRRWYGNENNKVGELDGKSRGVDLRVSGEFLVELSVEGIRRK